MNWTNESLYMSEYGTTLPLSERIRSETEVRLSTNRPATRTITRARPQSLLASVQAHLGKASQPQRPSKSVESAASPSASATSRRAVSRTVTSEGDNIPSLLLRMSDDVPDTLTPSQKDTPSAPSTPVIETERIRMSAPSIMARTRARLGQMRATPPAPSKHQHPPTTSNATQSATTSSNQLGNHDSTEVGVVVTPDLSPTPKGIEAIELSSPSTQFGGINDDIHPLPSENMDAHSTIDEGEKSDAEMAHDDDDDDVNPDRRSDMYTTLHPDGGYNHGKGGSPCLQSFIRCVFNHHGVRKGLRGGC